jgi:hypothetical protein
MSADKKTTWGSPREWGTAVGIMLAVIGLLALISSFWTPDVASYVATGFLGKNSIVPSAIILIVGLLVAVIFRFLIKPKA